MMMRIETKSMGLVAGRRAGLTTAASAAGETASAKIRRVLPDRIAHRLEHVLSGFATATYRHRVILRVQGTTGQIRARLPASVATIEESSSGERPSGNEPGSTGGTDLHASRWHRVEVRAEHLGWLPPVLASLDLPFAIEQPDELRSLVIAFADRLRASAMTR